MSPSTRCDLLLRRKTDVKPNSFRAFVRALLFGKEIEHTNKELRDSRTRFYEKRNKVMEDIEKQLNVEQEECHSKKQS